MLLILLMVYQVYLFDNLILFFDSVETLQDYEKLYKPDRVQLIKTTNSFLLRQLLNEKLFNESADILNELIDIFEQKYINHLHNVVYDRYIYNLDFMDTIDNEQQDLYLIYNTIKQTGLYVFTNQYNDIDKILDDYLNFKLIKCYTVSEIDTDILTEINDFLSNKKFVNNNELQERVESIEKLFNLYKSHLIDSLLSVFHKNFIITNNHKDRIKCNFVYATFERYCVQETSKNVFRTEINDLLQTLGITKKRFTDGFLFLGIKQQNTDIRQLEQQRNQELEKIYKNNESISIKFN